MASVFLPSAMLTVSVPLQGPAQFYSGIQPDPAPLKGAALAKLVFAAALHPPWRAVEDFQLQEVYTRS